MKRKESGDGLKIAVALLIILGLICALRTNIIGSIYYYLTRKSTFIIASCVFGFAVLLKLVWYIWKKAYYQSTAFEKVYNKFFKYIEESNDLNQYIEELNVKHIKSAIPKGTVHISENIGSWNYNRNISGQYLSDSNVYNCSLQVLKGVRDNPYKYLCKYFEIPIDEKTIELYEEILNDYFTVEQGVNILLQKKEMLINNLKKDIPWLIRKYDSVNLMKQLNFMDVSIDDCYQTYTFQYLSPGGNSGQSYDITLDEQTLSDFIEYLSDKVETKNSIKGQRLLMTKKLREEIKNRDNYTCCQCGVSITEEPHLLLEVDHIIPVTKGGKTVRENLRTLCWKCNRSKSNKVDDNIVRFEIVEKF